MSFRQLLLQLGFLLPGSCIFTSRSESTVEMVQKILYTQIHIWKIMSTHLIWHQPRISIGELLHHTLNECGDEGSEVFRGTQREPVRNLGHVHIWTVSIKYYISQLNILSTVYVTQTKILQSNNAFQHTHNPVDEEGTQKLIKLIKVHNAHTKTTQYNVSSDSKDCSQLLIHSRNRKEGNVVAIYVIGLRLA